MSHMENLKHLPTNEHYPPQEPCPRRRQSERRSKSTNGSDPDDPSFHLFEPPVLILDGEEINSFLRGDFHRKILPPRPSADTYGQQRQSNLIGIKFTTQTTDPANFDKQTDIEIETCKAGNLTSFLRNSVLVGNKEDLKRVQNQQASLGRSSSSPVIKEHPSNDLPQNNIMPAQGNSSTNSGQLLSVGTITTLQNMQSSPVTIRNTSSSHANPQFGAFRPPQPTNLSRNKVHQLNPTTAAQISPMTDQRVLNTNLHRSSSCGLPLPPNQTTQIVLMAAERTVTRVPEVSSFQNSPLNTFAKTELMQAQTTTMKSLSHHQGNLAVSWANAKATEIGSSFNVNPKEFFNKSYVEKPLGTIGALQLGKQSSIQNITNVNNSHIAFKSDPSLDIEENRFIKQLESKLISKDNRINELEKENAELKRKIEQLLSRIRELEGINNRGLDQTAEIQRLRQEESRISGLLNDIRRLKETELEYQRVSQNELSKLKFDSAQKGKEMESELHSLRAEKANKDHLTRSLEEKGMMKDGVLIPVPKIAGFTPEELYEGLVRAEAEIRRLNQLPQESIDMHLKEDEESHRGDMLWENERLRSVIWHLEGKLKQPQADRSGKDREMESIPIKRVEDRETELRKAMEHIANLNSEIQRLRSNQVPVNVGGHPIVISPSYTLPANMNLTPQQPQLKSHYEFQLHSRPLCQPISYWNSNQESRNGPLVELVPKNQVRHLEDENRILKGVIDSFSSEKIALQRELEETRLGTPRRISPYLASDTPVSIPAYLQNTADFVYKQTQDQPSGNGTSEGLNNRIDRSPSHLGESMEKLERTVKSEFSKVNLTQQLILKKLESNNEKRSNVESKLKQKKSELDLILKSQLSITTRLANIQGLLEKIDGKDLRESTLRMLEEERRELLEMQRERGNLENVISDLRAKLESSRKSYLSSQNNSIRNSVFGDENHEKDQHFLRDLDLNMEKDDSIIPQVKSEERNVEEKAINRQKQVLTTMMTGSMLDYEEKEHDYKNVFVGDLRKVQVAVREGRITRNDISPVDIEVICSDSRIRRNSPHQQSPLSKKNTNHVFGIIQDHSDPVELDSHVREKETVEATPIQISPQVSPTDILTANSQSIVRKGQRPEQGRAVYMLNVINEEGIEHSQEYNSGVYTNRFGDLQQATKGYETTEDLIAPLNSDPLLRRKVDSVMPEVHSNSHEESAHSTGGGPFSLNFQPEDETASETTGLGARRVHSIMPKNLQKADKAQIDEIAAMKEQLNRLKEENQTLRHKLPSNQNGSGTSEKDTLWREMEKSNSSAENNYKAIDYVGDRPSTAMGARFEFVNTHDKEEKWYMNENIAQGAIDKKKTESIYNFHPSSDMFSQLGNYLNRKNDLADHREDQKEYSPQQNRDSQQLAAVYGNGLSEEYGGTKEDYENLSKGCEFKSMNAHTGDKTSYYESEHLNPELIRRAGKTSENAIQPSHNEGPDEPIEMGRDIEIVTGKDSTGIHFKSQETIRQSQELSRMCITEIENIISAGNKNDKMLRAFPSKQTNSNDGKYNLNKASISRCPPFKTRRSPTPL
jgi:hypothetical protein